MYLSLTLLPSLALLSSGSPTSYGTNKWQTKPITNANGPVTAGFRGLSVVSDRIVWVSGTKNSVFRTTDGGATWDDRAIVHNESFTNETGTYPVVLDFNVFCASMKNGLCCEVNCPQVVTLKDGGVSIFESI